MDNSEIKIHCKYDKLVDPKSLKEHPKNRNKHPKEQIKRLAKMLKYYGVRHPIVVDPKEPNVIIVGRGRQLAMIEAGITEAPVVFQEFLNDDQKYGFIQADNAISDWSEIDYSAINYDLAELDPSFDIEMLGIDGFEIDVADKYTDEQLEATPEPPAEPITKLGDLWQLGEHRLLCGDSTDILQVEKLMNGKKADVVFTDPPYNLQQNGQTKRTNKTKSKKQDFGDWDIGFDPETTLFLIDKFTKDISHRFVCTSSYLFGTIHDWFVKQGDKTNYIVWVKKNPMPSLSKSTFVQATELVVHSRKGKTDFIYPSGANLPNVVTGNVEPHEFGHPTQKPIYFIEYFLKPTTGLVLDLFAGSGSTLIACEKSGRVCYTMELDPAYCDVVVKRFENLTGQKAVLINE